MTESRNGTFSLFIFSVIYLTHCRVDRCIAFWRRCTTREVYVSICCTNSAWFLDPISSRTHDVPKTITHHLVCKWTKTREKNSYKIRHRWMHRYVEHTKVLQISFHLFVRFQWHFFCPINKQNACTRITKHYSRFKFILFNTKRSECVRLGIVASI